MNPALTWTCETCQRPIAPGQGAIWCDDAAAYRCLKLEQQQELARYTKAAAEGRELVVIDGRDLMRDGDALRAAGYPVPWHAQHHRCDSNKDRACYWVDVEPYMSLDGLLQLNQHLAEKSWLPYTDWPRFMRRIATGGSYARPAKAGR